MLFQGSRVAALLSALALSACTHSERPVVASHASALNEQPLSLSYLGAAGWQLSTGEQTLLLDPYFTRAAVEDPNAPLLPNPTAIAAFSPAQANYILVGHSHYDHLLDVPSIAARTGATVVGSPSTLSVARAAGMAEERLQLARPGQILALGAFTVRPIASQHSITGEAFGAIPSKVTLPLTAKQYEEGTTLAYWVGAQGRSIIFFDSANFDETALAGLKVDIAVVATALREKVPDYTCRLLRALGQPGLVLPTHFDAHWQALEGRRSQVEPEQVADVQSFVAEVKSCAPSSKVLVPNSFEAMKL